jgi:CMP-N-acetylneuraminic acid synthetase
MKKNDDTICIICARGGSKGLSRKNTLTLDGIPLIARPIIHAKESGAIGTILVTTDDVEIAEIAIKYGAEVPFLRPKEFAGDLTTTEDTLKHALLAYEKLVNKKFEICVFITATDIFRKKTWIKECVDLLRANSELESVFVGHKTHKNYWEKAEDGSWHRLADWMKFYSSRQVRKPVVREDTGLGCASRAELWRCGRRIGDKVEIIIQDDDFTGIDIHSLEDLELARAAIEIRKK